MLAGFLLIAVLLSWASIQSWLTLEHFVAQSQRDSAQALELNTAIQELAERTVDLGEVGRFLVSVAGDPQEIDEETRSFDKALGITFVFMYYDAISLQRVSLGALIIALGLLVDDAMIAVEMMVARLEAGDSLRKAATYVYTSTAFPMLTGTLVTVAGFIPIGLNNSAAGEAIYDPFLGSGTTLIAAETTGRVCHAVDIDPRYVDVAIQRWQRITGKAAVLAGEERVFNDIAAARGVQAAA